jgi:uncharacterized repeat protein (TIGR03803 family)
MGKQQSRCTENWITVLAVALVMLVRPQSTQAQIFTVLHSFTNGTDGGTSFAGLVLADGNLYGTTTLGGNLGCNVGHGCGTVFSIRRISGEEGVLYSFSDSSYGAYPYSGLLRDSIGNLYGTFWGGATSYGGVNGLGAVFEVNPAGNETILHSFTGAPDGQYPEAGLVKDSEGNLYGTTTEGGTSVACADGNGCGTIFKIDGVTGTETVLYSFAGGTDGGLPVFGTLLLLSGNLYGTTQSGGVYEQGTVFKFNLKSGKETVVHSFSGFPTDGTAPQGGLIRDTSGNLYGTTFQGGSFGPGTVFKINIKTGFETVLYSFAGGSSDGSNPYSALVIDKLGNLYGTTYAGGANGCGTIFELPLNGAEIILHSFSLPTDGGSPFAGLVRDSEGNLYGTTENGGPGGFGTVFKLVP